MFAIADNYMVEDFDTYNFTSFNEAFSHLDVVFRWRWVARGVVMGEVGIDTIKQNVFLFNIPVSVDL